MPIIEENYHLFCHNQGRITRWPSPGNPFLYSIDYFRPAVGTRLTVGITPEAWKTQALQRKITGPEINQSGPAYVKLKLGKILWEGRQHLLTFRPGNVADYIMDFRDTQFMFMDENNCEIYTQIGFTLEKKEVRWRTEGGEELYVAISDPNGFSLETNEFFYIDFDFQYAPDHYLKALESGDFCPPKKPKNKKIY